MRKKTSCPFSAKKKDNETLNGKCSIFTIWSIAAARPSADTFFSESHRSSQSQQQQQQQQHHAEQHNPKKTVSRQSLQHRAEPSSRHQKRSGERQFRKQSGFQYKDSNFEFSSDWNQTDYYGSVDVLAEPVTEMTDAKMQELGFPVHPAAADNSPFHNSERHQNLPAPSVIDKHSQFFQLMSRKYCSPLGNNWDPTCLFSYVLILFPISIQDSQFL